ncbi:hypothetical protein FNO01nite_25520 [Flavobacterium noncentrifugens]|nr:hypothetical protein FNO01nite_25520 [Flavobacterium noncentrifugens]
MQKGEHESSWFSWEWVAFFKAIDWLLPEMVSPSAQGLQANREIYSDNKIAIHFMG